MCIRDRNGALEERIDEDEGQQQAGLLHPEAEEQDERVQQEAQNAHVAVSYTHLAAHVLDPDPVALAHADLRGGIGMQIGQRIGMRLAQTRNLALLRVEVLPRAGTGREDVRVLLEQLRRGDRGLRRLLVVRQRIEAPRFEQGVVQLALARVRVEAGLAVVAQPTELVLAVRPVVRPVDDLLGEVEERLVGLVRPTGMEAVAGLDVYKRQRPGSGARQRPRSPAPRQASA